MITFEINIADVLNTIVGVLLGAILTLIIVERRKTKDKRKILLDILRREIDAYRDLDESMSVAESVIGLPHRNHIFLTVLSSDVLDTKKDKDLIELLHHMVGWVENYNSMNNIANLGILLQSPVSYFNEGRNILNKKSRAHQKELKGLLKNYK